jgi:hypothetical protein
MASSLVSKVCRDRIFKAVGDVVDQENLCHPAYIQVGSERLAEVVKSQLPTMYALARGTKAIEVYPRAEDVPGGCISETMGTDAVVHLLVWVRISY